MQSADWRAPSRHHDRRHEKADRLLLGSHRPGAIHCFLRMGPHTYFSFVQMPAVSDIPVTIGVTHAGRGELPSAKGTMQHVSFGVETEADLLAMRDRIRSHGVNVLGPVNHGFCHSIYFAGPEDLTLEVAWGVEDINAKAWVDPKCLDAIGASAEESARFLAPRAYAGPSPVAQPPFDPAQPHLHYPEKMYRKMIALPDMIDAQGGDWSKPPVEVAH
jgi:catechol 2,3-dioxygenase-like lactoylglutathione lyase family enzyme